MADYLKLISRAAEGALNAMKSMNATKPATRRAMENAMAKSGLKSWDIEYAMQDVPRDKIITPQQAAKMVRRPEPVLQQDYSWGTGGAEPPFMTYQRVVSPEQEEMLGDTAYKELPLFQLHPKSHFRNHDSWFKHYGMYQPLEEGDTAPLGFTLRFGRDEKLPKSTLNDLKDLDDFMQLRGRDLRGHGGEMLVPGFTGHYSLLGNTDPIGYNIGHMRVTDLPQELGRFRILEEMQSDLSNKRGIDAMLRNNDVVLPPSLRDRLYVPPEIERGSSTMMTNAAVMSMLNEPRMRGLAIPNEFILGRERNFTPDALPSFFKEMYGEPLNRRLNQLAKDYGGEFSVIPMRDVPKFMAQDTPYNGRGWINWMDASPIKYGEVPTRVLRFPNDARAKILKEGLPHWKRGGLATVSGR